MAMERRIDVAWASIGSGLFCCVLYPALRDEENSITYIASEVPHYLS